MNDFLRPIYNFPFTPLSSLKKKLEHNLGCKRCSRLMEKLFSVCHFLFFPDFTQEISNTRIQLSTCNLEITLKAPLHECFISIPKLEGFK